MKLDNLKQLVKEEIKHALNEEKLKDQIPTEPRKYKIEYTIDNGIGADLDVVDITQNDIDELNKKSSYGTYKKVGEYKLRQYLNLTIYHETTLEKLMYSWNYEMKLASRSLELQEIKVANWKPVKTLREMATERLNQRKKVA